MKQAILCFFGFHKTLLWRSDLVYDQELDEYVPCPYCKDCLRYIK